MGAHAGSTASDEALAFLGLVAHPVRWRLLQELVQSDRAVWELTQLLDERQSLVSYHLTQLRKGELVRARRSSADGRDSYYSVDLARCGAQLRAAGRALHPALAFGPARVTTPEPRGRRRTQKRPRILFLCTGNSARSQMAEALVAQLSGGAVDAASAGSHPKPLHPMAVKTMASRGIDISANRSKHVDDLRAPRFDLVVTLCDRVREVCPELPSRPRRVHWSVPDPALEAADGRGAAAAFERTARELETRLRFLLPSLLPSLLPTDLPHLEDPTKRRSAHAER